MKMGMVLGGRRKGPRSKKVAKKRKQVKVAIKVKGNVDQVQKAVQKLATGAAKGSVPVNPSLQQDQI
jgi:hypothetical protein